MLIKLVKINQQSIKNFFYANIYQLFELNLIIFFFVIKPNLNCSLWMYILNYSFIAKNTKIVFI